MNYSNFTGGGFLTASSSTTTPCIFKNLSTHDFNSVGQVVPTKISCSNEKIHSSAILCDAHLKAYFNLGIKLEHVQPSDNTMVQSFYALKYAAAPDSIIPFPMKLQLKKCVAAVADAPQNVLADYEFCLDQKALYSGFSGFANFLPPQVLGSLLTNSTMADHFMTDLTSIMSVSPGVGQSYMPILVKNAMLLEKHFEHVRLFARCEDVALAPIRNNANHLLIPMNMLPGFYKFLFYYAQISTLSSNKGANEYQVKEPNLILNLDTQAFEVINKSSNKKIFIYSVDGKQTISTNVVLAADKRVADIQKESGHFNITSLISHVPVCNM